LSSSSGFTENQVRNESQPGKRIEFLEYKRTWKRSTIEGFSPAVILLKAAAGREIVKVWSVTIFVQGGHFGQQFDLDLLDFRQALPLAGQEVVDLFMSNPPCYLRTVPLMPPEISRTRWVRIAGDHGKPDVVAEERTWTIFSGRWFSRGKITDPLICVSTFSSLPQPIIIENRRKKTAVKIRCRIDSYFLMVNLLWFSG
jgi:hypothetical protein